MRKWKGRVIAAPYSGLMVKGYSGCFHIVIAYFLYEVVIDKRNAREHDALKEQEAVLGHRCKIDRFSELQELADVDQGCKRMCILDIASNDLSLKAWRRKI